MQEDKDFFLKSTQDRKERSSDTTFGTKETEESQKELSRILKIGQKGIKKSQSLQTERRDKYLFDPKKINHSNESKPTKKQSLLKKLGFVTVALGGSELMRQISTDSSPTKALGFNSTPNPSNEVYLTEDQKITNPVFRRTRIPKRSLPSMDRSGTLEGDFKFLTTTGDFKHTTTTADKHLTVDNPEHTTSTEDRGYLTSTKQTTKEWKSSTNANDLEYASTEYKHLAVDAPEHTTGTEDRGYLTSTKQTTKEWKSLNNANDLEYASTEYKHLAVDNPEHTTKRGDGFEFDCKNDTNPLRVQKFAQNLYNFLSNSNPADALDLRTDATSPDVTIDEMNAGIVKAVNYNPDFLTRDGLPKDGLKIIYKFNPSDCLKDHFHFGGKMLQNNRAIKTHELIALTEDCPDSDFDATIDVSHDGTNLIIESEAFPAKVNDVQKLEGQPITPFSLNLEGDPYCCNPEQKDLSIPSYVRVDNATLSTLYLPTSNQTIESAKLKYKGSQISRVRVDKLKMIHRIPCGDLENPKANVGMKAKAFDPTSDADIEKIKNTLNQYKKEDLLKIDNIFLNHNGSTIRWHFDPNTGGYSLTPWDENDQNDVPNYWEADISTTPDIVLSTDRDLETTTEELDISTTDEFTYPDTTSELTTQYLGTTEMGTKLTTSYTDDPETESKTSHIADSTTNSYTESTLKSESTSHFESTPFTTDIKTESETSHIADSTTNSYTESTSHFESTPFTTDIKTESETSHIADSTTNSYTESTLKSESTSHFESTPFTTDIKTESTTVKLTTEEAESPILSTTDLTSKITTEEPFTDSTSAVFTKSSTEYSSSSTQKEETTPRISSSTSFDARTSNRVTENTENTSTDRTNSMPNNATSSSFNVSTERNKGDSSDHLIGGLIGGTVVLSGSLALGIIGYVVRKRMRSRRGKVDTEIRMSDFSKLGSVREKTGRIGDEVEMESAQFCKEGDLPNDACLKDCDQAEGASLPSWLSNIHNGRRKKSDEEVLFESPNERVKMRAKRKRGPLPRWSGEKDAQGQGNHKILSQEERYKEERDKREEETMAVSAVIDVNHQNLQNLLKNRRQSVSQESDVKKLIDRRL